MLCFFHIFVCLNKFMLTCLVYFSRRLSCVLIDCHLEKYMFLMLYHALDRVFIHFLLLGGVLNHFETLPILMEKQFLGLD